MLRAWVLGERFRDVVSRDLGKQVSGFPRWGTGRSDESSECSRATLGFRQACPNPSFPPLVRWSEPQLLLVTLWGPTLTHCRRLVTLLFCPSRALCPGLRAVPGRQWPSLQGH